VSHETNRPARSVARRDESQIDEPVTYPSGIGTAAICLTWRIHSMINFGESLMLMSCTLKLSASPASR
jgi:hypothetical protein